MIKELAKKNRSYRRFYENKKITEDELKELVDTGRNTPSAANIQPMFSRQCQQGKAGWCYWSFG